MYGSYGSYSSMSYSSPIDIKPRGAYNDYSQNSCAFPSWPRRTSLSGDDGQQRATSYLSDDELFPTDIDDDVRSITSASSTASPVSQNLHITEEELMEMERQRIERQREYVKYLISEKERRRQAARKQRRSSGTSGSSSSKKSPKDKFVTMAPIVEAGE